MKLDEKATIEATTTILEQYKTLRAIAGEKYVSKITPTYSFEPRCYTGVIHNPLEDHIIRQEQALELINKIDSAINKILDPYLRQVLIERYIKNNISNIAIYMDLGYSSTEFYRLLDRAKLHFAEHYNNGSTLRYRKGKEVMEVKDLLDYLGQL